MLILLVFSYIVPLTENEIYMEIMGFVPPFNLSKPFVNKDADPSYVFKHI